MQNSNNPATSRQLWALYCITKKDYRNDNLTKEQAAKLISELGSSDYKKKVNKSLSEQLLEYLKLNFDKIFGEAVKSLNYKSILEDDPSFGTADGKKYAFIGVGCGITYPIYRKNNKKLKEIDEAARKFHYNEIEKLFLSKFTKDQIKYYESIGNSLTALWCQDQGMQQSYWFMVKKFAESKGLKMEIKSMID